MLYTVEGDEIDPRELEDGTWVTQKTSQDGLDPLDLQHKHRKAASKPAEARPEHASTQALHVQATRPPQLPPPDDSIRGVVYKAYTDETDQDFQAELMKKNPDIPIVNSRRLGSSRHLKYTPSGRDPRPVSNAGGLGTTQTYARCPALEHQNAEDAEENIHHRTGRKTDMYTTVCRLPRQTSHWQQELQATLHAGQT
ncbi:hypothetical protein HPB49_025865 [Dermacentor silvarum]|nr:hypothetical protein HPB49_025865 [Dermacentor silvarum]